MMDPIPMTSTILVSSEYTMRGAITSYVSNAVMWCIWRLPNPWSTYTRIWEVLHYPLQIHNYHHLLHSLDVIAPCFLFYSQNVQCGPVCHNRNTTLGPGAEISCCFCFVSTPYWHPHIGAPSPCVSTSRLTNAPSHKVKLPISNTLRKTNTMYHMHTFGST